MENRLAQETSPYLLQHAHNPVDWYPWGEEALGRAKREDKPILVSIGYSACHWCHVMERESFEDPDTAALMNAQFVNIKIDREERPDLDHIYMDAVTAMTGSGGWPLNVFLTPEGKPFYGGTYFPPSRAFNRPSWKEVLTSVSDTFREKRDEVEAQAKGLTDHLFQSNTFGLAAPGESGGLFSGESVEQVIRNLLQQADREWGGFGRAPKFPQTFSIVFLLRAAWLLRTGRQIGSQQEWPEPEQIALLSLDRMIRGGIYDQVGGGFARYATDTEWLVPHFEKMLYDNALLLSAMSEALQLTGREIYRDAIHETMAFVQRELMHPGGGFYAALDADSEGEEGRFYVWKKREVEVLLGEDAALFCDYYGITEKGNWEGKNILWVREPVEEFARNKGLDGVMLQRLLGRGRDILLTERAKRVRPGLDDKIILGWNALMNSAASQAYAATGHEPYRLLAIRNMEFLYAHFRDANTGRWMHTWKEGRARFPAFLDDYAFLVRALIQLQEITADARWLDLAGELTLQVLDRFGETGTGLFYYTGEDQADVIVRKKEVYDGALPSGNAVMAGNLYQLSLLFDRPAWREQATGMVQAMGQVLVKYPGSFGMWASLLQEITFGTLEIAVTGPGYPGLLKEVLAAYIPHRVLMSAEGDANWPLLSGRTLGEKPQIWLCENYSCRRPVQTTAELISLINSGKSAQ